MKRSDYPALYRSADDASNSAQKVLIRSHLCTSVLLVAAGTAGLVLPPSRNTAVVTAILFLASLGAHLLLYIQSVQKEWYQARALAESVKTATWRLLMRADPFASGSNQQALGEFLDLLKELLAANHSIGASLGLGLASADQVTPRMRAILSLDHEERAAIYLSDRIRDQRRWYQGKAARNRAGARVLLAMIVAVYGAAIVLALLRIQMPTAPLPVDVLAILAGTLIGWKELRRYDELASAYALTAHEVGLVESRYSRIASAADLSDFVSDAENAFSREHTQWAARRDH